MIKQLSNSLKNSFKQADQSHSRQGSGLGLAIVKKIVEIYAGEIKFTSGSH